MDVFFRPRSVAVFGASRSLDKPGRVILRNLVNNFRGRIYPVNPHADELDGLKCYSPADVPKAELGVFAIPAPAVVKTLEEVGDRLKGALIVAGGFGESGRTELDRRLLETGEKHGLRIWGPNCLGTLDAHSGLNTLFLPLSRLPFPERGNVSILSQSGATVAAVLDWASTVGLGVSKVASYGNQLDVSDYEILEYFQKDPETDVIGFYVEGLKDGRKLLNMEGDKPVVVLKAGRTGSGVKAARSHTGALAGNYEVFRGVARQLGWHLAPGPEEFLMALKARSLWRRKVHRVGIVTCGGGFGVMASDAVEKCGMELAKLSEESLSVMKDAFPERVSLANPVDLTGDATPEMFAVAIEQMLSDRGVDAVIAIILLQLPKLHAEIIDVLNGFRGRGKPVVVVSPPGAYASGVNELVELPLVSSPEKAARVLAVLD